MGRKKQNPETQTKGTKKARATAQEPHTATHKLKYAEKVRIGTLSTRGIKQIGKREKVETWMEQNNIMILALQETHIASNTREEREQYTWFFSGEGGRKEYTAGVGFVVHNKFMKYILDIEPLTDRLCSITLNYVAPITLVAVYIPQAMRPIEEKEDTYSRLEKCYGKHKSKGPTYVMEDMNARVQKRTSEDEEGIVGQHTFEPETADPWSRREEVFTNRQFLVLFAERTACA